MNSEQYRLQIQSNTAKTPQDCRSRPRYLQGILPWPTKSTLLMTEDKPKRKATLKQTAGVTAGRDISREETLHLLTSLGSLYQPMKQSSFLKYQIFINLSFSPILWNFQ